MSINVKSPSPPFTFLGKNVTLPREAVKIYSDPPLPPDKHGLCNLLARIKQPPIYNYWGGRHFLCSISKFIKKGGKGFA